MADCLILPVGVSNYDINPILDGSEGFNIKCIITVTVPGLENEKSRILEGIRTLSMALGINVEHVIIKPWNVDSVKALYNSIMKYNPGKIIVSLATGSRYLYPVLTFVLLKVWRESKRRVEILAVHGIEGESYRIVEYQGYVSPVFRISSVQRKILKIIYESKEPLSGKDLIEKYGFTRTVYYVLADLERKGLLRVKRGIIEKTWPGYLYYELSIKEVGGDG